MPVVMVIAIIVVVAAVVLVARGRGDGLSVERIDYVELDLGPVSATDVALLRPPTGLWGYNMQATDEAMEQIAESIRERDVRIVALEQLVTDLSREPSQPLVSPYVSARHRRAAADPAGFDPAGVERAGVEPAGVEPAEIASAETASASIEPLGGNRVGPEPTFTPPWAGTEPSARPPWPAEPDSPVGSTASADPARSADAARSAADDDLPMPPEQSHD